MIAFLCPGQGMERSGMGQGLAERYAVDDDVRNALIAGLHGTERAQPALVAVALATAAALAEHGVTCDVVAGHSVGELAAFAIAGGCTPGEAVALARARGAAMGAAATAPSGAGAMWAVDVLPDPLPSGLVLAVENPGQFVLSGPGVPPRGARAVPTSGAWHSPAMASAVEPFRAALAAVPSRGAALDVPVASNHDGRLVTDSATFRAHLVRQLTSTVRWCAALDALVAFGVTDIVVLGPGRPLATWCAGRTTSAGSPIRVHRTDRVEDVATTASAVRHLIVRPSTESEP